MDLNSGLHSLHNRLMMLFRKVDDEEPLQRVSNDHQHMHDLMAVAHVVKAAGIPALGEVMRIAPGCQVEHTQHADKVERAKPRPYGNT